MKDHRYDVVADTITPILTNLTMAFLYVYFAWSHLHMAAATHQWLRIAPIIAGETLIATLFLTRRFAYVSEKPLAWIAAGIGTFSPLLLRASVVGFTAGAWLQTIGVCVSIAALLSLRRSFGLVAAFRGTVSTGLYAYVRHPQYFGHLLLLTGYLLTWPTVWNAVIVGATITAMAARVIEEEELLMEYFSYQAYAKEVPYRFIPGVF